MRIVKAICLIGILAMPIGLSTFITFDDDDTLYELLESMNEEEEEEDDDECKHNAYEFFFQTNEDQETNMDDNTKSDFYFSHQLFQSVKLEVKTPPPRG